MTGARLPAERMPDLAGLANGSQGTAGTLSTARTPSPARLSVIAPFTGEVFGEVPCATRAGAEAALERARQAQPGWARVPMRARRAIFLRLHDRVMAERERLMDLIQLEGGKARAHAFEEVLDVAIATRYYAIHGPGILKPERRKGALPLLTTTTVYHHPVGVVGVITPWNYPLTLSISDAVPALMAGNCVVVKPSELTPFSALYAARMMAEAGLPEGVYQVVVGEGAEVGNAIAAGADFVQFTGSTVTGRKVARAAAEGLARISLELGGKNAAIVFDDADLERAVAGVLRVVTSNSGQLCVSVERLYVQAGIYDRFVARLGAAMHDLRLGSSFDYSMEVGSLHSRAQLDKVAGHVREAVSKGARVLAGGRERPDLGPFFYEPTLLEGVTPGMAIYAEETFGPVAAVYRFQTEEEAVEQANASAYGLSADVWTGSAGRGARVAQRIRVGTVNINEGYPAAWGSVDAPMGGMKQSGIGRRHGPEGILKYTEAQTVARQALLPLSFIKAGAGRQVRAAALVWYLKLVRYIPGLR